MLYNCRSGDYFMNNQELLRRIENKATREQGGPFVLLEPSGPWMINKDGLLVEINFPHIPVRSEVKKMLDRVDSNLKCKYPDYQLVVARGWSDDSCIEIPQVEDELLKIISESHLTGGTVDVFIGDTQTRQMLDFGTGMYQLDPRDRSISNETRRNRYILNSEMTKQDFAPSEMWWHFSYGDRVHAVSHQWGGAIYGPKSEAEMSVEVGILKSNLVIRP